MKKYVMYLRKSRYDTDYEMSSVEETIKRHKAILTDYARKNNLSIIQVFQEVVSGESISQRPEMMKLLDMISTEEIEGILCMDIDRLARGNSIDQGIISQTLKFSGTKIITPYKIYDPGNEFDEEYMEFGLFMSRKEYNIINRRLERGRKQSSAEGRFMGSCAPYGYEIIKLKGEKGNTLQIVPHEAEIVKKIFNLYCNHGYGYIKIVNFLNDLGIPSAKGGTWCIQTVKQMLNNAVYAGYIRSGYKKSVKKLENGEIVKHRVYNANCDLYKGKHEAIVSKEIFDKVQSLARINTKNPTNNRGNFNFIFSMLIRCSQCGCIMKCVNDTREQRKDHKYRILCRNKECDQSSVKLREVEKAVHSTLREWLINYRIEVPENSPETFTDGLSRLSRINREIEKTSSQRTKICELLETEVYSIEMYRERDKQLQQKLHDLHVQKEELEKESNIRKISKSDAMPKIEHLLDTWDTSSAEEKHGLLKQVIARIDYTKPKRGDMKLDIYPNF